MDEMQQARPVNPRRRKKTPIQIFKETYLPVIIAGAALLMILIFIIGSIVRGIQYRQAEHQASLEASASEQAEFERQTAEATALLAEADARAAGFDYEGAIALLDGFSGDASKFPQIAEKRAMFQSAQDNLVLWDDPSKVINLSFQLLIADPARAFSNADYKYSFNKNFVTTEEFSMILQQLYENGYILISMSDIVTAETNAEGASYFQTKPLYLPNGKKPLMLTQTNVNYNNYLIDSDGDRFPDKDGGGFASRLLLDENNNITCEMVDSQGNTVTGAYDLVPILESFIATHPDFSYKGARAVLALTGYDGLFGYRTNAEAADYFGTLYLEEQQAQAGQIADALRSRGYELACYTYGNIAYGESSSAEIKADLSGWTSEVLPILGEIDMLVYAQKSDIASEPGSYNSELYSTLKDAGFKYFLGFVTDGTPWLTVEDHYIRQGRILVDGNNISNNPEWFNGIFDAYSILDPARNDIS